MAHKVSVNLVVNEPHKTATHLLAGARTTIRLLLDLHLCQLLREGVGTSTL